MEFLVLCYERRGKVSIQEKKDFFKYILVIIVYLNIRSFFLGLFNAEQ